MARSPDGWNQHASVGQQGIAILVKIAACNLIKHGPRRMRLMLGLLAPFVLLTGGYLLWEGGLRIMSGGLYFIAGLLAMGTATGALLRSTWSVPYTACAFSCLVGLALLFEIGGMSAGRSEDRSQLVSWIFVYAALGGFGAAVGVEMVRQDTRKRG